jgi:hypothetical protein
VDINSIEKCIQRPIPLFKNVRKILKIFVCPGASVTLVPEIVKRHAYGFRQRDAGLFSGTSATLAPIF